MTDLTSGELALLEWLAQTDYSQYGECYGENLDGLITKGLAQIHGPDEHQNSFIAQGSGPNYRAVSLTEKGRREYDIRTLV